MSQKPTILFDLDGTLIDTAPDLMSAHNHVMKKFGYIERELDDIKKLAGRGSKVMIKKSIHEITERTGKIKKTNENEAEEMTKEFINYYSQNICNESKPRVGVLDFLTWCKKNSILMAVCTNKQEHLSIDLLKKIKLYDFFDYIAGGNTFNYNKPDPRHLTSIIEIVGGNLKKSIMIGDSETDSKAAKEADVTFILIENGYTEKKPDQIHYNHLIKNFVGLEEIIQKYIND
jgi:phosphoglycolate phosphatase